MRIVDRASEGGIDSMEVLFLLFCLFCTLGGGAVVVFFVALLDCFLLRRDSTCHVRNYNSVLVLMHKWIIFFLFLFFSFLTGIVAFQETIACTFE